MLFVNISYPFAFEINVLNVVDDARTRRVFANVLVLLDCALCKELGVLLEVPEPRLTHVEFRNISSAIHLKEKEYTESILHHAC